MNFLKQVGYVGFFLISCIMCFSMPISSVQKNKKHKNDEIKTFSDRLKFLGKQLECGGRMPVNNLFLELRSLGGSMDLTLNEKDQKVKELRGRQAYLLCRAGYQLGIRAIQKEGSNQKTILETFRDMCKEMMFSQDQGRVFMHHEYEFIAQAPKLLEENNGLAQNIKQYKNESQKIAGLLKSHKTLNDIVHTSKKFDPYAQFEHGNTLLHIALQQPAIDKKVINWLLDQGCSCAIANDAGMTPIHVACFLGYKDIVEKMLQTKIGPVGVVYKEKTSENSLEKIDEAVEYFKLAEDFVYDVGNLEAVNNQQETLFFLACRSRNIDLVSFLIHSGFVDVLCKDAFGRTVLHDAVIREDLDMIVFLLANLPGLLHVLDRENSLPIDYQGPRLVMLLKLSLLHVHLTKARFCKDAELQSKSISDALSLVKSTFSGEEEELAVRFFAKEPDDGEDLQRGIMADLLDVYSLPGGEQIFEACVKKWPSLVNTTCTKRTVYAPRRVVYGLSPLEYCLVKEYSVDPLLKLYHFGAKSDSRSSDARCLLHRTFTQKVSDDVRKIVYENTDPLDMVLSRLPNGNTILHTVIEGGHVSWLLLFLPKLKGLICKANNDGDTPLHGACRIKSAQSIELLLDYGGDMYAVNSSGESPASILRNLFKQVEDYGKQQESIFLLDHKEEFLKLVKDTLDVTSIKKLLQNNKYGNRYKDIFHE